MRLLQRALIVTLKANKVIIKKDGSRNLLHLRHKAATLAVFLEISVLEKSEKCLQRKLVELQA